MSDKKSAEELEDLDKRLHQAREKSHTGKTSGNQDMSGYSMAIRIGTELVAALIVGVGIGYFLDNWLDTKPWFLVVFFFLGAAAGVLNVYRAASGLGMAVGYAEDKEPTGGVPSQMKNNNAPYGADENNKETGGK
ncbi:MAG: AtpZ/AtpI family protein [Rhodospirillaceae bacterium]|jgi:ATP synthase protein I|nr:AtpZ/AtpI family protein [Rhodospirillaceae bacterium]MBT5245093.1 AtpZ/AtpI family protein [Rhodospirillaceae bacterium]MBT6242720.1 AtpZ/AtpI family protein [Rhodospirillaceae bacterium]MBT7137562.1 AtpZ/AtpI family protein [Rhodospirillaceae bacterium]